jgi:hypothetical protein
MKINYGDHQFVTTGDALSRQEVENLSKWCEAVLSPESDLATALDYASQAVSAFVNGSFVKMTSEQLWDKGYEASEACSGYDGSPSFFAIFDHETNEISVCSPDTNATISLASGTVMVV